MQCVGFANPPCTLVSRRSSIPMRSALQMQASNRNGPVAPQGNHVSSQNAIRYRLSVRTVGLCTENTAVFEFIQHLAAAERAQARALAEFRRHPQNPSARPSTHPNHPPPGVSTTGRDSADFREPGPDENEPKPEPWPSSAAIRKIRPSKSPAPNVSTTGRDPDFREPAPDENEPKPTPETLEAAPSENQPKPEPWPSSVAIRKIRPPGPLPIQIISPGVSTTGRDPATSANQPPMKMNPSPSPGRGPSPPQNPSAPRPTHTNHPPPTCQPPAATPTSANQAPMKTNPSPRLKPWKQRLAKTNPSPRPGRGPSPPQNPSARRSTRPNHPPRRVNHRPRPRDFREPAPDENEPKLTLENLHKEDPASSFRPFAAPQMNPKTTSFRSNHNRNTLITQTNPTLILKLDRQQTNPKTNIFTTRANDPFPFQEGQLTPAGKLAAIHALQTTVPYIDIILDSPLHIGAP